MAGESVNKNKPTKVRRTESSSLKNEAVTGPAEDKPIAREGERNSGLCGRVGIGGEGVKKTYAAAAPSSPASCETSENGIEASGKRYK